MPKEIKLNEGKDGAIFQKINMYKDPHLIKFIFPGIVFDEPGSVVFCSEGKSFQGDVLTLKQDRAGLNVYSHEGLIRLLEVTHLFEGTALLKKFSDMDFFYRKGEVFETDVLAMFKTVPLLRFTGMVPRQEEEKDSVADLLLTPLPQRLRLVEDYDPERTIYGILRVISTFFDQAKFSSYKPQYRQKMLALSSRFAPKRDEFMRYMVDHNDLRGSMYDLLFFFS